MGKSKSKIFDLLYGKILAYSERIEYDDETESLISKSVETEKTFCKKIKRDAELTELFEKFVEDAAVANLAENDVYYADGFKTGLLIGIEVGEWIGKKLKR